MALLCVYANTESGLRMDEDAVGITLNAYYIYIGYLYKLKAQQQIHYACIEYILLHHEIAIQ